MGQKNPFLSQVTTGHLPMRKNTCLLSTSAGGGWLQDQPGNARSRVFVVAYLVGGFDHFWAPKTIAKLVKNSNNYGLWYL